MADSLVDKLGPELQKELDKLLNGPNPATRVPQSDAVNRCYRAWARTHAKGLIEGDAPATAKVAADKDYRFAMPPLIGLENISDFIACVAFGTLIGTISPGESTRLLYAAQVAIGAQRANPTPR